MPPPGLPVLDIGASVVGNAYAGGDGVIEVNVANGLALGRLDTVSYKSVKWLSAKRAPMSIATSAVMSAIVKRSPATK